MYYDYYSTEVIIRVARDFCKQNGCSTIYNHCNIEFIIQLIVSNNLDTNTI